MYELGELPFNGMSGRHRPIMGGPASFREAHPVGCRATIDLL